jgi:hypothetical protein
MPIKLVKKIDAWSHSRKTDYKKCPRLAKFKYVDKIKEPPNKAMKRGSRIHDLCEKQITEVEEPELPEELQLFPHEFEDLRAVQHRVAVEQEIALTDKWQPTSWFGKDAWVRIKIDALIISKDGKTAWVIDFKTGSSNYYDPSQLELYGVGVFASTPTVQTVKTEFWYLDEGQILPEKEMSFTRSKDFVRLKKKFEKDTKKMLSDTQFNTTPSNFCDWCYYSKNKTGKCKF